MLIQKDSNSWSISTVEQNGLWHIIFDESKTVIDYFQSIGQTSTFVNLFVGTKEECDQYIADNGLIYSEVVTNNEPIPYIEDNVF